MTPAEVPFRVRTLGLDLPALAATLGRRLHDAGVPVTAERAAWFARALSAVEPVSRRRLYWTARGVFVTDTTQTRAFDAVFASVFGSPSPREDATAAPEDAPTEATVPDETPGRGEASSGDQAPGGAATSSSPPGDERAVDTPFAVLASDEEVLRSKRFDALSPAELAHLYRLMTRMRIATPLRRTRRAERDRHGARIDLRRTLRGSLRTAGDPIHLARRRRRIVPRRLVLLCDISGSMEPYARAYLQFLTCAAGGGRRAEAFVFATRLTRLTRALQSRNPERAIQRAATAAPDWSSGTRIGDALKAFNDRHGRRGMARGAVIVILSDGWERGDPALVAREMQRLRRVAHRIVWVNPRVSARGFEARAGGLVAALPHCDALVSGHTLEALNEVVDAIGGAYAGDPPAAVSTQEPEEEPWPSATPVPGSSVAMPSGYGPSRGKTTPGWSLGS
ncbi:MAG TPA: VWA domain-containing protein [Solirubrobacteraceae bacterium]|nr:VWA domain-containing protein [Solirubrobacteraceae bacterium]HUA72653.1 VWA domain-containing protein [Solirubrobacteraceae bacterium]